MRPSLTIACFEEENFQLPVRLIKQTSVMSQSIVLKVLSNSFFFFSNSAYTHKKGVSIESVRVKSEADDASKKDSCVATKL
jgi:hypothetical protein